MNPAPSLDSIMSFNLMVWDRERLHESNRNKIEALNKGEGAG
jgi:hypothetical protein